MLSINVSDFTLNEFTEELTYPKHNWSTNLFYHSIEGGYVIRISINGRHILNDPQKRPNTPPQGYILYMTLKSINNAFYHLLTGEEGANIIISWGSSGYQRIAVKKEGNKVFFTTIRNRLEFDDYVYEEAIKATLHYKSICTEAAREVVPDDIEKFTNELFGKRKTDNKGTSNYDLSNMLEEERIYRRDQSESWQPLEEAWIEYKKNNI